MQAVGVPSQQAVAKSFPQGSRVGSSKQRSDVLDIFRCPTPGHPAGNPMSTCMNSACKSAVAKRLPIVARSGAQPSRVQASMRNLPSLKMPTHSFWLRSTGAASIGTLLGGLGAPGVVSLHRYRAPMAAKPFKAGVIAACSTAASGDSVREPSKTVVVVESPAKAKAIEKYLGPGYEVLASFGHVRDLPSKKGSVRPDDGFAMTWEVAERAKSRVKAVRDALKGAQRLVLATDPDREGEAISWHVLEMMKESPAALRKLEVVRVTFTEITKQAVLAGMAKPRTISVELVEAYLARRALDYLMGFWLSPVLWKKLPGSKSAGRVQSVALRLICEREAEVRKFKPQEYWTVEAVLGSPEAGVSFDAQLVELDGQKLDKLSLQNEEQARRAQRAVELADLKVSAVETRQGRRNPPAPFITSTLQQEASTKLGWGASSTMYVAQQLYEGPKLRQGGQSEGLITYIRTDGTQLSKEAVADIRELIRRRYGSLHAPPEPRLYTSRAKNAQEAHEAIRPTDINRLPSSLVGQIEADCLKLYSLIWRQAVACQMASAVFDQHSIDVLGTSDTSQVLLRTNASVERFSGWLEVHRDDKAVFQKSWASTEDQAEEADDEANDESTESADNRPKSQVPKVSVGESLQVVEAEASQHFTKRPPRYTEGSLVKRMEELGIGRPSTYASILRTLRERQYIVKESKRLVPEPRGELVVAFLLKYFQQYVDYSFTAQMEEQLDEVSAGALEWKQVLESFWGDFKPTCEQADSLAFPEVESTLDKLLEPLLFPSNPDEGNPRQCPACKTGQLHFKLSKTGGFLGCNRYPDCGQRQPLQLGGESAKLPIPIFQTLGNDPETGLPVTLRTGPFGPYVQLGEKSKGKKVKRTPWPQSMPLDNVSLADALALLRYPRELGTDPESGEPVLLAQGGDGLFLRIGKKRCYAGVPEDLPEDQITLEVALKLLEEVKQRQSNRQGRKKGTESKAEAQPDARTNFEATADTPTTSSSQPAEAPRRGATRREQDKKPKEARSTQPARRVTPAMAQFLGNELAARSEVMAAISGYFRDHNLKGPEGWKVNERLSAVLELPEGTYPWMQIFRAMSRQCRGGDSEEVATLASSETPTRQKPARSRSKQAKSEASSIREPLENSSGVITLTRKSKPEAQSVDVGDKKRRPLKSAGAASNGTAEQPAEVQPELLELSPGMAAFMGRKTSRRKEVVQAVADHLRNHCPKTSEGYLLDKKMAEHLNLPEGCYSWGKIFGKASGHLKKPGAFNNSNAKSSGSGMRKQPNRPKRLQVNSPSNGAHMDSRDQPSSPPQEQWPSRATLYEQEDAMTAAGSRS